MSSLIPGLILAFLVWLLMLRGWRLVVRARHCKLFLPQPRKVDLVDRDPVRKIPPQLRTQVLQLWGERCAYCRTRRGPFQIDHLKPWARGGSTVLANLAPACQGCNGTKSDRWTWRARRLLRRGPK